MKIYLENTLVCVPKNDVGKCTRRVKGKINESFHIS